MFNKHAKFINNMLFNKCYFYTFCHNYSFIKSNQISNNYLLVQKMVVLLDRVTLITWHDGQKQIRVIFCSNTLTMFNFFRKNLIKNKK